MSEIIDMDDLERCKERILLDKEFQILLKYLLANSLGQGDIEYGRRMVLLDLINPTEYRSSENKRKYDGRN